MLQLTPHHRLLLAVNPVDFRKGINSLIALCQQHLNEDAYSGTIFVFTNKRRIVFKLLVLNLRFYPSS
ncbi:IS66 family insertion sequence element accessory protein TnpB [Zooshikella ganghwensis]|uniref:IS66 family insertion sequence element accessory protein TnpB n=1 Tax=Zooshikella ganghwensis TaxID=202772 RepID=UPI00041BD189|nr:IS66 family insertion sequence element accessory protein TnpB [Zooshikella ganghwensis]